MATVGDIAIKWHTAECQAEQSGELVEVEVFNGDYWQLFNLDAHHTVGDLLLLNDEITSYLESLYEC